jgi:hypothetical protein
MTTLALDESDLSLRQVFRRVKKAGGSLVVTRRGKPLLLIRDLSGEDAETIALSTSKSFARFLAKRRAEAKRKGTIDFDEVCRKAGLRPVNKG